MRVRLRCDKVAIRNEQGDPTGSLSFLKQTQQEGRKEVSHITNHSAGRGQQHTADAAETD